MKSRVVLALLLSLTLAVPAAAETERLPFESKGRQRRGPTEAPYSGLARNRGELRELWSHFNMYGDPPAIDFEKNVAILASIGGSSSCGMRLHDLRLKRDRARVIVRMYVEDPGPGNGCTDDLAPFTFTVSVERSDLRPLRAREVRVSRRRIDDPHS